MLTSDKILSMIEKRVETLNKLLDAYEDLNDWTKIKETRGGRDQLLYLKRDILKEIDDAQKGKN